MAQTIKLKRSGTEGNIPTTSQLELGEVAINTYDGKMYIKKDVGGTESIVEISAAAADAILVEYQFTSTASQTTYSGSDDNTETLSYTPNAIQVFMNGILLDPGIDFTATNGTSIVLAEAADANDYLQIFAFKKKIGDGNVSVDTFTGDDSTVAFTLSVDPGDENNTRVFIDGVYQSKSNYSVSGTTLTFSTAPPTGTAVEVEIGNRVVTLDTLSDLDLPDDVKLRLGTDQDLQIYHDGSHSYINEQGTGNLYLNTTNGGGVFLTSAGENLALFNSNGATNLYYDNSEKLATTNDGVAVTGDVEATGEIIGDLRGATLFKAQAGEALAKGEVVYISGISGNTTIVSKADADDASKMPAFGLVAAAASSGNPVDIYTNGILSGIDTSSYSEGDELFVSTTAGALTATPPTGESAALQKIGKVTRSASSGSIFIVGAGRSNAVPNLDDGDIFIGNSSNQAVSASLNTKIESYLDGGTSTPTFAGLATTANMTFGDNGKAIFGAGSDLQIYHDGTRSLVRDVGTGDLVAQGNNLSLQDVFSENYLTAVSNGAVTLYHNGLAKLATTSTGIDVTGTVTADGLTVDGTATIDGGASANTVLTLDSSTANTYLKITDSNSTNGTFIGATTNDLNFYPNNTLSAKFASGGDISFYEDTGTTAKFHWDAAAESLGIGTDPSSSYSNTLVADQGGNYTGLHNQAAILVRASTGTAGVGNHQGAISFSQGTGQAAISGVQEGSDNDVLGLAFWTHDSGTGTAAAVERMRIDSSGALGLGTTPPSTNSHPQMFIGTESVILGSSSGALDIGNNLYYNSGWKYRTTGAAALQDFDASGNIVFYRASSGTANAAVTLNESMRIGSSGLVTVKGSGAGSVSDHFRIESSDTESKLAFVNTTGNGAITQTGGAMRFMTNTANIERMRLDASGVLYIGSGHLTNAPSDGVIAAAYADGYNNAGGDLEFYGGRSTGDNAGGEIKFFTGAAGSPGTQINSHTRRMTINADGNVGIGSTSPATKLEVAGTTPVIRLTDSRLLDNPNWDNVSLGSVQFYTSDTSSPGARVGAEIEAFADGDSASAPNFNLLFKTATNTGTATEKLRIDKDGRVGIGTTSPVQALDVVGSIQTDTAFRAYDSVGGAYRNVLRYDSGNVRLETGTGSTARELGIWTAGTERIRVDTSGNVGVGTTSPAGLLHVKHASGEAKVIIQAGSNTSSAVLQFGDSLDTSRGAIEYTSTDDMAFSTNNMTEAMRIRYTGNVGIGTTSPNAKLEIKGASSTNYLQFNNSSDSEIFRIDSNFRWGWGTTTPSAVVHITGQSTAGLIVENGVGIASTQPYVSMAANNYSSGYGTFRWEDQRASQASPSFIWEVRDGSGSVLAYDFRTGATGAAGSKLAITQSGNVGIGTTAPSYKLDVRDGIVFAGRAVSDAGGISYTNTAAVFSSRGVDHDAARSNVLRLMRDGTSGVQYAGVADFDLESWESNGVFSRTAMTLKLGHGNLPDATDVMTWRSNGNVGIGTTNPAENLHVYSSSSNADVKIEATSVGDDARLFIRRNNSSSRAYINYSDAGGANWYTGLLRNTSNVFAIGQGDDFGSNTRFCIDSSGNVGIGTTSPSAPLHIDAAGMGDVYSGLVQNSTTDTDHYNVIRWMQGASGSATGMIGTGGSATGNSAFRNTFVVGTQSSNDLVLASNDTERMRIDSSGNVGIGVSSIPSWANLMTSGTVAVGGILYIKQDQKIQALTGFPGGAGSLILNPDGGIVGIGTSSPATDARGSGGSTRVLIKYAAGQEYLELQAASTTSNSSLLFSDGSSGDYGVVQYSHATNEMDLYAKSNPKLRIEEDGIDILRGQKFVGTYTYTASWATSKQIIVPNGTLPGGRTYLVLLVTDSLGTPPYYAETAFLFRTTASTNGSGVNGTNPMLTSHHVGSSSYWDISTTTTSNSTNGLAAQLVNGPQSGGSVGSAIVRVYVTQIQGS